MRERNNYPQPRLYEWLDTEIRFIRLADVILHKHGKDVPAPSPFAPPKTVAYWATSKNETTFRLELKDMGEYGGRHYLLEKYPSDKSDISDVQRYFVQKWRDGISTFEKLDFEGNPIDLDETAKKEATYTALSILTSKAQVEAAQALRASIDRRFPEMAANYILSDLAVKTDKPAPETSDKAIISQAIKFRDEMLKINEAITILCTGEDMTVDMEKLNHLMEAPKTPDGRNNYRQFDLGIALEAVAKSVGKSWHNTIDSNHHDFIE